jgi:hypothetical protein
LGIRASAPSAPRQDRVARAPGWSGHCLPPRVGERRWPQGSTASLSIARLALIELRHGHEYGRDRDRERERDRDRDRDHNRDRDRVPA